MPDCSTHNVEHVKVRKVNNSSRCLWENWEQATIVSSVKRMHRRLKHRISSGQIPKENWNCTNYKKLKLKMVVENQCIILSKQNLGIHKICMNQYIPIRSHRAAQLLLGSITEMILKYKHANYAISNKQKNSKQKYQKLKKNQNRLRERE